MLVKNGWRLNVELIRTVYCGNCGKENKDINIKMRIVTETNKTLYDDCCFECSDCLSFITIRIENKRFKGFTNKNNV